MKTKIVAAALLASVVATAAARAEVITVPFSDSTPTSTNASYSGEVTVSVSGIGQSSGTNYNDAFYIFSDQSGAPFSPPLDQAFYDLGFGTSGSASSIDNTVSPVPAFNLTHDYTFNINTGLSAPAPLDFQLIDNGYADNTGAFTIGIQEVSASPEPSAWLLMLGGIGGVGLMLRQAKRKMGLMFKNAAAA